MARRRSGIFGSFGGRYISPTWVSGAPDEGAGTPEWVPANAKIHIDFLGGTPQGRAWVQGTGEVGVDTLLGNDPSASSGFGIGTNYDAESGYSENGYGGAAGPKPAFIGEMLTAYTTGCTCRIQLYMLSGGGETPSVTWVASNGNDALEMRLRTYDLRAYIGSWGGSLMAAIYDIVNITEGSINVSAWTLSGTRAEISVPATGVIQETDRPSGNPLVGVVADHANHFIQSITLYDPLPDTTGLSDLSQVSA